MPELTNYNPDDWIAVTSGPVKRSYICKYKSNQDNIWWTCDPLGALLNRKIEDLPNIIFKKLKYVKLDLFL
jgi:hypothetical protein